MLKSTLLLTLSLAVGVAQAETSEVVRDKLAQRAPDMLEAAEALSRSAPRNAEAWLLLARAQMMAGDFGAAVKSAERAVRLDRNDAAIQFALGQAYGGNINNVGMLSKLSYAGRIRDAFARAVELDPDHLEARSMMMLYYLQAPGIAGGSVAKAREQADEIAKRHPARGMVARGHLLQAEEKHDEAIEAFRAAVAADTSLRGAYYQLGFALQRQERWEDAFEAFAALVEAHPDEHGGLYQMGRTTALSGVRLEEGAAALLRYAEVAAGNGSYEMQHVHFRLGNIHEKAGRREEAAQAYRAALQEAPDFDDARKALQAL
ncbi:MAG TPA: tetratricopeptide repeat protein [Xanthomonadaceae bacterium]|nr:tetratricopeptide repeat protein [Xanthomonadaceae bacterium]